eukprot:13931-Heterococcus_DN1.PRE.1
MVVISTALLWLLWTCTAINLCARCTRAASAVHCSFALLTCYQNDLNMLSRRDLTHTHTHTQISQPAPVSHSMP